MQSHLRFSRLGRSLLQYANASAGFSNKLVSPHSKTTIIFRSINRGLASVQTAVDGDNVKGRESVRVQDDEIPARASLPSKAGTSSTSYRPFTLTFTMVKSISRLSEYHKNIHIPIAQTQEKSSGIDGDHFTDLNESPGRRSVRTQDDENTARALRSSKARTSFTANGTANIMKFLSYPLRSEHRSFHYLIPRKRCHPRRISLAKMQSSIRPRIAQTWENSSGVISFSDFVTRRPVRLGNRHRSELFTPPLALAKYLDLEDVGAKQAYWRDIKEKLPKNSLPAILLHHLYINSISKDEWEDHDHDFHRNVVSYLESRNYTNKVESWAWILSGDTSDQIVERLLAVPPDHPTFILLQVLRKDINHVGNLKKLLLYAWSHLERKCLQQLDSSAGLHHHEFSIMISRLLYQTRRIWPAATLSVVNMVPRYVQHLRGNRSEVSHDIDQRIYNRNCAMVNYVIPLLALPASIDPLKSMAHNWSAQKVLLNLAGNCDPPLILDKDSYRAVIQVLTASQKTEREAKSAILRLRSWPPWRTDQDGMDARRAPEDDLSRALLAAVRSKEAGFRETSFDQRLRILGGQELDGTPTIHTRRLVKWRRVSLSHRREEASDESMDDAQAPFHQSADPNLWAARVEATRDVREAWRAFIAFEDSGGKPNQALYLAMFQKLNFEQARQGRKRAYEAAPGDGKEVLPVPDDNMSDFYKSYSQPPSLDRLYKQMLSSGIRPSGKCLVFLVRHARTSTTGINYLRDSGLHPLALQYLTGGQDAKPPQNILNAISDQTLGAFIHLICRFAPHAVSITSGEFGRYKLKPVQLKAPLSAEWAIQQFEKTPYDRLRDPLRQASRLLKNEKVRFRPAWYSLFKGLARRNIVLRLALIGDPQHDALAWRFTKSVLGSFHECGLELDPYGFMLICTTFYKFAQATHHVSKDHEAGLAAGAQLLKGEFAKLCRSEALPYHIPTLLHAVRWVTLHIYVRCMGGIGDCEEVLSVLEWMVQHREELEECNIQDRNGPIMLTRTLVAARISCYETEYEERAMKLVKQVHTWKWPDDSDVELYTGSLNTDPDEDPEPAEESDTEEKR